MAWLLLSIFLLHTISTTLVASPSQSNLTKVFPAILIFGDSTVDTGNNNYIDSTPNTKCDHHPYGVDFPNGTASGRFSNGRLVPDMLASALGIKQLVPPFLNPFLSDEEITTGVCFASAGSGFDDLTAAITRSIPVSRQVGMFQEYISRLNRIVGVEEASKIINNALILISAGTVDLVSHFYTSTIPTTVGLEYGNNITGYQEFLLQRVEGIIKELHDLGGRKFAIIGLSPIGCVPMQISFQFKNPFERKCVAQRNKDSLEYNSKLQKMLLEITGWLQDGTKLEYVEVYDLVMDMIKNPQQYGFKETLKGCCGTGNIELGPACNSLTPYCSDRSKFLFWDAFHPSEAAYQTIVNHIANILLAKLY